MVHSKKIVIGISLSHQNPEFDAYFEKSFKIIDSEERGQLYQKMDSLVMSSHPLIPLYYDQVVRFTQKEVCGLTINPVNDLKLKKVKKQKNR